MPILINKIQDRQNIAKWKKEYSLISNAFQATYNEGVDVCGAYSSWGRCATPGGNQYFGPITDEFRTKMFEKLNVIDYCTNNPKNACAWNSLKLAKFKALSGTENIIAYNYSNHVYFLNDGAIVYLGDSHGGPWVVVDVNGLKGRTSLGAMFLL